MTPCSPTSTTVACELCERRADHLPPDAEDRPATIVIDASVVRRDGSCPMYVAPAKREAA